MSLRTYQETSELYQGKEITSSLFWKSLSAAMSAGATRRRSTSQNNPQSLFKLSLGTVTKTNCQRSLKPWLALHEFIISSEIGDKTIFAMPNADNDLLGETDKSMVWKVDLNGLDPETKARYESIFSSNSEVQNALKHGLAIKACDTSHRYEQILHEWNISSRLGRHENVAMVLGCKIVTDEDIGKNQSNRKIKRGRKINGYLVMENVAGEDINSKFQDTLSFEPNQIKDYAIQALEGIDHMHKNNVVHFDIKPGNIIISPDDVVKIVDFGDCQISPVTQRHTNGTPKYRAPEVCEQAHYTQLGMPLTTATYDYRADLFSFGCTLFEMVTGCDLIPDKIRWLGHVSESSYHEQLLIREKILVHNLPPFNNTETGDTYIRPYNLDMDPEMYRKVVKMKPRIKPWPELIPAKFKVFTNVIKKLTEFDRNKRCSIAEAIAMLKAIDV